ncbi:hypothetical protein [Streptomyces sp. NPDC058683]|uniref:hypothetical protein n=1 Tax=Streptomyces sp. NPDC058683 TaxID=3346597 RepID=UPI00365F738D
MGEWMSGLFGLLGAGVGAVAALWGAKATARSSLEIFSVQLRRDDERWIRDQRQVAYHAMLAASMECEKAGMELEGNAPNNDPRLPPELEEVRQAAWGASYDALSLVELCGPARVVSAARKLHQHATRLVTARAYVLQDTSGIQPGEYSAWQQAALRDFRAAARVALGYDAHDWVGTVPEAPS